MLHFMEEHQDLAQHRIQGPDGKKQAACLWEQLATKLNSSGSGTTKSTDKWIKVCYDNIMCIIIVI